MGLELGTGGFSVVVERGRLEGVQQLGEAQQCLEEEEGALFFYAFLGLLLQS